MRFFVIKNMKQIILAAFFLIMMTACVNPFSPAICLDENAGNVFGDQKTIDGFFKNFQYAYNFKDTITYRKLLDEKFIFYYRNYDAGFDASWTRTEDLFTTYRLFIAAKSLDLVWNDIIYKNGDSLQVNIVRSFNLSITFSPSDIVRLYGKANFVLARKDTAEVWKLIKWVDESTY